MAGTTISSSSAISLDLTAAGQNPVTVTSTGTIAATGSYAILGNAAAAWSVFNDGSLSGAVAGVQFAAAGSVTNGISGSSGGAITGGKYGVKTDAANQSGAAGTVTNFGTITATGTAGYGIDMLGGGSVANGAVTAGITGGQYGVIVHGAGSVGNAGTITGTARYGIEITGAGTVVNGSAAGAAALIQGYGGVFMNSGNVVNDGSISAGGGPSVVLRNGGNVYNGSAAATGAVITSAQGILIGSSLGGGTNTLTNFGTIAATGTSQQAAVALRGAGVVDNGALGSPGWGISGSGQGVLIQGAGTVNNYGTISGVQQYGVQIAGAASVVNGAGTAKAWLISGSGGVYLGSGTVANDGTLEGSADAAVAVGKSGSVANGSATAPGRQIVGFSAGVVIDSRNSASQTGTVGNFGTIAALSGTGDGVVLNGGGLVDNGAANATGWTISGGGSGVSIGGGAGTVNNYGTITGTSGNGIGVYGTAQIVNGSGSSANWLVQGATGIYANTGTVFNDGTVLGTGGIGAGVSLANGGSVSNGSSSQTGRTIQGASGISVGQQNSAALAGTVTNYGSIAGTAAGAAGVTMAGSGTVNNGAATSTGWSISGVAAGVEIYGAGAVHNFGTIAGTASYGISINGAATIVNGDASGAAWLVEGGEGVQANTGTITNDGTILGTTGAGVAWTKGADIVNATASARIAGGTGILFNNGNYASQTSVLTNFGAIGGTSASGSGVVWFGTASIANGATAGSAASIYGGQYGVHGGSGSIGNFGTISGAVGIGFSAAATVVNAGAIVSTSGASGTAIEFNGAADLLVAPGATFTGAVAATSGYANTLELLAGASGGTLTGLYTSFQSFTTIAVDANASWTLTGGNTLSGTAEIGLGAHATLTVAGSLTGGTVALGGGVAELSGSAGTTAFAFSAGQAGTLAVGDAVADGTFEPHVSNFGFGDTIDLPLVFNGASVSGSGLVLTENAAPVFTLQNVAFAGSVSGFTFGKAGADDTVSVACFAAGTRIATTARGEVAVEELAVGDMVRAHFDGDAEVIWLGHRRVDCRRHSRPADVWPVRVSAGAFGPGKPARDLLLSPDHAIYTGGALMPVRHLRNGATIAQEPVDSVDYWHVELAFHDVLLAEGLPCESYLDTGNRAAFGNGGSAVHMQPDFALRTWAEASCAKLVQGGARLIGTRQRLLRRARQMGLHLTGEPELRVLIDGEALAPVSVAGLRHRFEVRGRPGEIRIVSHSAVPAEVDPSGADERRLGVMLSRVAAFRPFDWHVLPLADQNGPGFHALETDGGRTWRWTDGDAVLTLPDDIARDGLLLLDLDVAAAQPHWRREDRPPRRRAM